MSINASELYRGTFEFYSIACRIQHPNSRSFETCFDQPINTSVQVAHELLMRVCGTAFFQRYFFLRLTGFIAA